MLHVLQLAITYLLCKFPYSKTWCMSCSLLMKFLWPNKRVVYQVEIYIHVILVDHWKSIKLLFHIFFNYPQLHCQTWTVAILIHYVMFRLQYADTGLSPMQHFFVSLTRNVVWIRATVWEECCMTIDNVWLH